MLKLIHGLHVPLCHVPVHLLGDDVTTAECGEVALHSVTFLGSLGEIEIARMLQEGTLVEVPFKAAGEEAHAVLVQFRLIGLTDEPVLLMHDAVVGQYLDGLAPAAVNGLVLL